MMRVTSVFVRFLGKRILTYCIAVLDFSKLHRGAIYIAEEFVHER